VPSRQNSPAPFSGIDIRARPAVYCPVSSYASRKFIAPRLERKTTLEFSTFFIVWLEFFIFFVAWLVLSGAAAAYASNKGRSGVGIFCLSLFLSPLVGFLVGVAMEPHQQKGAEAPGMKKCPECAGFVQADARTCRLCGHDFFSSLPTRKAS
jgi:hypothetical protein